MSFGLDVIYEILAIQEADKKASPIDLFVIPLGTEIDSFKFVSQLRKIGVKADIEKEQQKLRRSLKYANSINVPYVIIIGENELQAGKVRLKNMKSGEQIEFAIDDYIGIKNIVANN